MRSHRAGDCDGGGTAVKHANMHLSLSVDKDGVATILWSAQDGEPNVFSEDAIAAFDKAVEAVAADDAIKGVIVASAGEMFHAGADLKLITAFFERTPEQLWPLMSSAMEMFRKLESCGKPVVAAINGHALGGGFEMALACHARIIADNPRIKLGLPEASIGLMPGFGGTQRLARMGDFKAATRDMIKGKTWSPKEALSAGFVTEIVPAAELMGRARKWVLGNPGALQPWAKKDYVSPALQPGFENFFTGLSAGIARSTWNNFPAERLIAEAVYHGLQMPIEPALRFELRRFIEITREPAAQAMVRTNFFSMKDARSGKRRPKAPAERNFSKIGVIGGGLMGGGIACQAAKSGLSVTLVEVDQAAAERGLHYSERLLDRAIKRGHATQEEKARHLARILPTTDYSLLGDCDLVIEAVFEDAELKYQVLQKAEIAMRPGAVLASNTSTIPIGQLADALSRKDCLLGLHFFSPVEKMALVEIISGAHTSEETLAAGFDLAKLLGKIPVSVRDGRGFFTTRVVVGYMQEGAALLAEGVAPALIENAGRMAGMPMGPLRLTDMVHVDLIEKIEAQTQVDLGVDYVAHPGRRVGLALLAQGRTGERAGAGFYDHGAQGPQLWPGLTDLFPPAAVQPAIETVAERLMFRQLAETLRCFDDGVLNSAADADVGSVLGWGFAPHTGGVASYIDHIGAERLLAYCIEAERQLGPRFAPARTLRELAQTGERLAR